MNIKFKNDRLAKIHFDCYKNLVKIIYYDNNIEKVYSLYQWEYLQNFGNDFEIV